MFELIVIRRQRLAAGMAGAEGAIDVVGLAEAMLFYQRVHLVADIDMISYLARVVGPARLIRFVEEGYLRVSYVEKRLGIRYPDGGIGRALYEPVTLNATQGEWAPERAIPEAFSKAIGAQGAGRQYGRRFAGLVQTADLTSSLINEAKQDFVDAAFVEPAVEQLLKIAVPSYRLPQDYRFRLVRVGGAFSLDTNIDFGQVNAALSQATGVQGANLSAADLLIQLFEARGDLHFASRENAELATHEARSAIIGVKFGELINAATGNQRKLEEFQRAYMVNSHEIGESLRLTYRTWEEFLELLKRAEKFKAWLAQLDPSVELVHEYIKALEKDTWVGSLPVKVARFILVQGVGLFAPGIVNAALSAADSLLFERLVGGWKPSRFVNGPLKRDFTRQD